MKRYIKASGSQTRFKRISGGYMTEDEQYYISPWADMYGVYMVNDRGHSELLKTFNTMREARLFVESAHAITSSPKLMEYANNIADEVSTQLDGAYEAVKVFGKISDIGDMSICVVLSDGLHEYKAYQPITFFKTPTVDLFFNKCLDAYVEEFIWSIPFESSIKQRKQSQGDNILQ